MQDRFSFRTWHKPTKTMEYNGLWTGRDWDKKLCDCNIIMMQCTGLIDKNGKLIFEGDIVRDINIPSYFCIVEWIKGGFYLKSTVSNSFLLFDTTQQEVIGNIYENPELLEDNK